MTDIMHPVRCWTHEDICVCILGTDLETVLLTQDAGVQGLDGHLAYKVRMKLYTGHAIKLRNWAQEYDLRKLWWDNNTQQQLVCMNDLVVIVNSLEEI